MIPPISAALFVLTLSDVVGLGLLLIFLTGYGALRMWDAFESFNIRRRQRKANPTDEN